MIQVVRTIKIDFTSIQEIQFFHDYLILKF